VRFQKKSGKYDFGGGFFSRVDFFDFFSFDFLVVLVKRLSVRETQKRKNIFLRGRASTFPPLTDFFGITFFGVSR
jgi:hypothetical protein